MTVSLDDPLKVPDGGTIIVTVISTGDGSGTSALSSEPPEPRQPLEVLRTGPHREPPIPPRAEPATRPRRRPDAMRGLELLAVNQPPAASSLSQEAGVDVAGGWHGTKATSAGGATGGSLRPIRFQAPCAMGAPQ